MLVNQLASHDTPIRTHISIASSDCPDLVMVNQSLAEGADVETSWTSADGLHIIVILFNVI